MTHAALKILAGIVWLCVGAMLASRGLTYLLDHGTAVSIAVALACGGIIGVLKGKFVLSRTARRNIRRIAALENPRPWNVFSGRFVILIGLMMGLGFGLRAMAEAEWLSYPTLGGIYVGIGLALAVSALAYFAKPKPPMATRTDACPGLDDTRTGLLVVNLGTPDAPTPKAVRRYLREFLGDERVIEVNRWLWAFVLNVIILPRRSGRSAAAYAEVWDDASGSPLLRWTTACADKLRAQLGDDWRVAVGMRYGNPGIAPAIEALQNDGCRQIIVLPLYPQYSNTTTGTTQAHVAQVVARLRNQPTLSFVPPFPDHPGYVAALAQRVRETTGETPADHYVFSFHGLPEAYVKGGDPYVDQCARTSWALARELELEREQWEMVFQSRFGDEPWLQPYLDEYVPGLAGRYRRVLVTTPGFAADCLETVEEVGIQLRRQFAEAGGNELLVVPALNDHPLWIEALTDVVTRCQLTSTAR